jgi:hypothetical protein
MSEGVALEEFESDPPARDFRRANGAPMVRRLVDPTKWDRYSRPSGFGSDLDDESALVNWKIDRAIEGVAADPSLAATIAAHVGTKEGAKDRRERAIQRGRGEDAADIGTALHAMTHRVERGDDFKVPPQYAPDIAAYLAEKDRAGLESELIEVHLVADDWRAAGTADRIYRATRELSLPDGGRLLVGQKVIGDLKTGAMKDYTVPGYCIQLAIYADGELYDVEANERLGPIEGLRTDWGLIVHMPVGAARCELLWCNLEVGRLGARIVGEVRAWRKRGDFLTDFKMPEDDEMAVMDTPMHALEHLEEPVTDEIDSGVWLGQMVGFALARIETIGTVAEARSSLLRQWPSGVDKPHPLMPTSHMARILDLLDAVEAAYHIPWPTGDPRVDWGAGLHKSELVRTNQPPSNQAPESEQ